MKLEPGTWTADLTATHAHFTVRSFFSRVHGSFDVTGASLVVDDQGRPVSVEATLAAASVATGNAKRDKDLRSRKFFDVDAHPTIGYRSTAIETTGDGWRVTGELLVGDSSAPVILAVVPDDSSNGALVIRAIGEVDRAAAGIKAPPPVIGRVVSIEIGARLTATADVGTR